ncbi:MAG: amidohydrolase family protein [Nannocystaceae bacterium]
MSSFARSFASVALAVCCAAPGPACRATTASPTPVSTPSAVVSPPPPPPRLDAATTLVLRADRIIDVETGSVMAGHMLRIDADGRIAQIGDELEVPAGAELVELPGHSLLPGLIDAHTHLCSSYSPRWHAEEFLVHSLANPTGYRAILGVAHAGQMLEAGFTTVRDLGNAGDYADVDLRRAIERGIVPGPTVIPAGRIIAPYGGQFSWRTRDEVLDDPDYFFADTRDELRKAIRENVYKGAMVIKIVVDGQDYGYSEDDIRFIVEQAAEAGLEVAAHCQSARGVKRALAAGVASIEHGWVMDEDDFAIAKAKGIALVSTDFPVSVLQGFGWDEAGATRIHQRRVDRLRRAHEAGVPLVFGTDVMVGVEGETRGTLAASYVDSFIEAGISPPEILRAATVDAARLVGVDDQRGRIEVGLMADLVAVPGNPLDDASLLRQVDTVIKDGELVRDPRRARPAVTPP